MRKCLLVVLYLFISWGVFAQRNVVSGVVKDSLTGEPLSQVNIWLSEQNRGTITDKEGRFSLSTNQVFDSIHVSCIGYKTQHIKVDRQKKLVILLSENVIQMNNFDFKAGENPAFAILKKVHEKMTDNNPQHYSSYKCKYYSKSIFSSDVIIDSLTNAAFLDTLNRVTEEDLKLYALLSKQHLFMMESVIEKIHKRIDKNYEKILASKISGFSDPIMHLLTTEMHSFSFYDQHIIILGKPFENPLFDKRFQHYNFYLEDSTITGNDTIYTISFQPKPHFKFKAISGSMQITSDHWAVKNIMLSPIYDGKMINIVIEQNYQKIDNEYWFPSKNNVKISINVDIMSSYPLTGYFSSTYYDIEIGTKIKNNIFIGGGLYTDDIPNKKTCDNDSILTLYRTDSITAKEEQTYLVWDTISQELKLEKMTYAIRAISSGHVPIWIFDLDVPRILAINKHEGCRLGFGLHTNSRMLTWMTVGGFIGYGFKDKTWKAGMDVDFKVNRKWNTSVFAGITYDLISAGAEFDNSFSNKYSFSLKWLNNIPSVYYDNIFKSEIGISSLITRQLQATILFSYQKNKTGYNYSFLPLQTESNKRFNYSMALLRCSLKFSFSRMILTSNTFTLNEKDNYPTIEFTYTRGIKGFLKSDFAFNEYKLRIHQQIFIPYVGTFSYIIRGGLIDKPLPLSAMYAVHGSYMAFGFFDRGQFATMKANEFLSDRFISLHLSQLFLRLYTTKFSAMAPEILFNFAFGGLHHPEYHNGIDFQTMEKGYYEVGCMLHQILSIGFVNLGAGVYYRCGAYSHDRISDNFSFRLSFTIGK